MIENPKKIPIGHPKSKIVIQIGLVFSFANASAHIGGKIQTKI